MYIAPDTNVKILRNVPLDENYEHTVHFGDSDSASGLYAAQTRFFNNYVAYNLTDYTYQRLQRGYIRVGIRAESLYNCNYLMFQNTAFGNKWFYAFILGIEYINNEVSQIQFEIDVMQTWMFNYKLGKCFVERMTPKTDYIGENIIAEPVALGEFVYNKNSTGFPEEYKRLMPGGRHECWVIIAICDAQGTVDGKIYNGVYGGATLYVYNPNIPAGITQINDKITEYKQKPDAIVGIYMIPSFAISEETIPGDHKVRPEALGENHVKTFGHPVLGWKLDGYTPKNCKLYTYPYNFININNGSGDSMVLRYEFFKMQTPKVAITSTITQPVTVKLNPVNYKCVDFDAHQLLDSETLELTNYPLCSWAIDAYAAWVAQNAIPIVRKIATTALSTAATIGAAFVSPYATVLGAAAIGAARTASEIKNAGIQSYKASISADIAKGNFNAGSVNVSQHRQNFYTGRMSVNYQHAQMIDEYFTRFGYAQNKFMVPTKHNRPYWTYLKTIGCILQGSVPKNDAVKICEVHNNGCLFLDPQFVSEGMDFTKDNSPGGGLHGYDPNKIHNGYNPGS